MTFDQPSLLVPRPLKNSCTTDAAPAGSLLSVVSPLALVAALPHCEPQNTKYTFGAPVVTPTPLVPPPYDRLKLRMPMPGKPSALFFAPSTVGTSPCRHGCAASSTVPVVLPLLDAVAAGMAAAVIVAAAAVTSVTFATRRMMEVFRGMRPVLSVTFPVRGSPRRQEQRRKRPFLSAHLGRIMYFLSRFEREELRPRTRSRGEPAAAYGTDASTGYRASRGGGNIRVWA